MLPSEIYNQILKSSFDSDHAIRRLGKLFRAGHVEAKVDYDDILNSSFDSDQAINRLEYLASEAKEGGGTLMLPSKTYRQILGSSFDSDQAINRLSKLLKAGSLEIAINYKDILNSSFDSDHAVARLMHLSSSAREGIFMHIDETSKVVRNMIENELLRQQEERGESKKEKKSLSEIAQESFQEVNKYFSRKRISILTLSSKTYNQVIDSSFDSDHAVNRMGRILKSGPLGLSVIYNDILATSFDSDHAINRLEYLASEAKKGGGFITLPPGTYNQILESSFDSDQAINRLGRLFRNGTVDLSVDYNEVLATSFDSDHAMRKLRGLGLQAKEGVLRPIKEKTEELEKKIEQELVERENRKGEKDDDIKREKKSASEIAQEIFKEVNKEFGKKYASILKLSTQTYRQILDTSFDSDHAIERLGILLSSGPVRIPINYKDVLDTSFDSDHAISRMEYLGSQTNAWKREYDERLNRLYVNNFKLKMLREGYTPEEIE